MLEPLKKFMRAYERIVSGPSNREVDRATLAVGLGNHYHAPGSKPPLPRKDRPGLENVLEFEYRSARLTGALEDVLEVRMLDNMIHGLTLRFNKISSVPDEVIARIESHARDLEKALSRVTAHDIAGRPLGHLVYVNKVPAGGRFSDQIVARIPVGPHPEP